MKIFKFGGASIKDALGVKNVAHILQQEGASNCLLVISAMGKMTNAFENIVFVWWTLSVCDDLSLREDSFACDVVALCFRTKHSLQFKLRYRVVEFYTTTVRF